MKRVPKTASDLIAMVRQAIETHHRGEPHAPVDDEALALLASGRAEFLSETPEVEGQAVGHETARDRLLRHIAADPNAAELLRRLHVLNLEEADDA